MSTNQSSQRGTISRSTADASMAFLQAAWKGRLALTRNERLGFGQFFYIFISSYLESQIFALINIRLDAMRTYTQTASSDAAFRLAKTKPNDSTYFNAGCEDLKPAFFSLFKLIEDKDDNLQRAALLELVKIYGSLFPVAMNVLLEEECWADLLALGAIRNRLAHGRIVSIEFEGSAGNDWAQIDSSSVKPVADRLRKEGIIPKDETIPRDNYHQWENKIFCDEALLYFYGSVSKMEIRLKSSIGSNREIELITRLPRLIPLS